MFASAIVLLFLSCAVKSESIFKSPSEIRSAFQIHEVVPDVIDVAPKSFIYVSYDSGVSVDLGKELTPTQVRNEPIKVHWVPEENTIYTLCMTDPDAPSRVDNFLGEVLHWLVVNVPGNDLKRGEELVGYRGSAAPKGTGLHRYAFLAYKQPGLLTFDEPRISNITQEGRLNFSIRKFAAKYNLGQPVAGNFFQAQYDSFVDILQRIG